MKATLSDLHRKTAKVIRPVIHGGKTVEITNQGEVCAKLVSSAGQPRQVKARLVKREGRWIFELPKGVEIDEDAIARAVREERESR